MFPYIIGVGSLPKFVHVFIIGSVFHLRKVESICSVIRGGNYTSCLLLQIQQKQRLASRRTQLWLARKLCFLGSLLSYSLVILLHHHTSSNMCYLSVYSYVNQHITLLLNYPYKSNNRIHACYNNDKDIDGEQKARIKWQIMSCLSSVLFIYPTKCYVLSVHLKYSLFMANMVYRFDMLYII